MHWYAHCNTLDKPSLRNRDEEFEWRTTEEIEVSSATGSSANKGPRVESCEAAALICYQFKVWPLTRTLLNVIESINSKYFPHIPTALI